MAVALSTSLQARAVSPAAATASASVSDANAMPQWLPARSRRASERSKYGIACAGSPVREIVAAGEGGAGVGDAAELLVHQADLEPRARQGGPFVEGGADPAALLGERGPRRRPDGGEQRLGASEQRTRTVEPGGILEGGALAFDRGALDEQADLGVGVEPVIVERALDLDGGGGPVAGEAQRRRARDMRPTTGVAIGVFLDGNAAQIAAPAERVTLPPLRWQRSRPSKTSTCLAQPWLPPRRASPL